ncbi:LysR family transcriptional regulator [Leifsonia sp. AG29]|uniref:LysR family transcriptional regulator n=1 Tax=Leifsonia sp. AG29 TaxID=2598860 RepID=UPI00131D38DC|nr:LysR family transcriptional regulator [Leifsonia sp. AG29]
MDPWRLRLLRELGDRGSVSAVAAALHITPSAVSQQLAALQAGIPVPLTEKRGRALALTPAGEALAAASRRVEESLAAAQDAVASFLDDDREPISVTAFHSAGLALFGRLLAELDADLTVKLTDADVAQHDFPRLTADFDLVIAHRLAHAPEWPTERLAVIPLFTEPFDIAMREDHPLAGHASIRPQDLAHEHWISAHEGFPLAGVVEHLGALAGRPPRIDHRVNEFFVAAEIVRTSRAIAVMPRLTAAPLAVNGLVLRPLEGTTVVRHVDVLARLDSVARARTRRVIAALHRAAEPAPPGADVRRSRSTPMP